MTEQQGQEIWNRTARTDLHDRLAGTRQSGQDRDKRLGTDRSVGTRSAWIGQRGEDGQNVTARTGQLGHDSQENGNSHVSEQPVQDSLGRTARTGQPDQSTLDRLVWQVSLDRPSETDWPDSSGWTD
jgi:hypothetical protein